MPLDPARTYIIATRGSALALAQSRLVLAQCQAAFPQLRFELRIIKTTGDKMQTMSLINPDQQSTKGLFTKELEVALLNGEADLAVHSLKDLPTELPEGLKLAAVSPREDVRDVLIYRDAEVLASHAGAAKVTAAPESKTAADASTSVKRGFPRQATLSDFPSGATIATSSTRRQAQLLAIRPDLRLVPIRGNVGTRLQKLAERAEIDALVLAAAGLRRLNFPIGKDGSIQGDGVPAGLIAVYLEIDQMIPCVGQAALGIETRANDPAIDAITARLNDPVTFQCVTGERAFLRTMGGGCLSPVACYGEMVEDKLRLRAISFRTETMRRGEIRGNPAEAADLGATLAAELK